jgi:hypothetical protein
MLQAGPASRMSPTFMTQLNACMVVKLVGSSNDNEKRVVEWRQKGLSDLSTGTCISLTNCLGIYLKVGSNIVTYMEYEMGVLSGEHPLIFNSLQYSPRSTFPSALKLLIVGIFRELYRNSVYLCNEE